MPTLVWMTKSKSAWRAYRRWLKVNEALSQAFREVRRAMRKR